MGSTLLNDRFYWAHNEELLTPEGFAAMLCTDFGIGGEFTARIAHSIREQLLEDRKVAVDDQIDRGSNQPRIDNLSQCFRVWPAKRFSQIV